MRVRCFYRLNRGNYLQNRWLALAYLGYHTEIWAHANLGNLGKMNNLVPAYHANLHVYLLQIHEILVIRGEF